MPWPTLREVNGLEESDREQEQILADAESLRSGESHRTPWRTWHEWYEVYTWLVDVDDGLKLELAMQTLKLWTHLPGCPIAVESTKVVLESILLENKLDDEVSRETLGSVYASCITRFITMYTDEQYVERGKRQAQNYLAQKQGIPCEISDMRNRITHKRQPDVAVLRRTVTLILGYLMSTYWEPQYRRVQQLVQPNESSDDAHPKNIVLTALSRDLSLALQLDNLCYMPITHSLAQDNTGFQETWLRLYQLEVLLGCPRGLSDVWYGTNRSICQLPRSVNETLVKDWLKSEENVQTSDVNIVAINELTTKCKHHYHGSTAHGIETGTEMRARLLAEQDRISCAIKHIVASSIRTFPRLIHSVILTILEQTTLFELSTRLGLPLKDVAFVMSLVHLINKVNPDMLDRCINSITSIDQSNKLVHAVMNAKHTTTMARQILVEKPVNESTQLGLHCILLTEVTPWKKNRVIFKLALAKFPIVDMLGPASVAFYDTLQPSACPSAANDASPIPPVAISQTSDSLVHFLHPDGRVHSLYHTIYPTYQEDLVVSFLTDCALCLGSPLYDHHLDPMDRCPADLLPYRQLFSGPRMLRIALGLLSSDVIRSAVVNDIVTNAMDRILHRTPCLYKLANWLCQITTSKVEAEELYDTLLYRHTKSPSTHVSYIDAMTNAQDIKEAFTVVGIARFKERYRLWVQYLLEPSSIFHAVESLYEDVKQRDASLPISFEQSPRKLQLSLMLALPGSTHPTVVNTWLRRINGQALTSGFSYPQKPIYLQRFPDKGTLPAQHQNQIRSLWQQHLATLDLHLARTKTRLYDNVMGCLLEEWDGMYEKMGPKNEGGCSRRDALVQDCMDSIITTLFEHNDIDKSLTLEALTLEAIEDDNEFQSVTAKRAQLMNVTVKSVEETLKELHWYLLIDEYLAKSPGYTNTHYRGLELAHLLDATISSSLSNGHTDNVEWLMLSKQCDDDDETNNTELSNVGTYELPIVVCKP